jgi:uncharacterized protein with PQ loop repeat
VWTQAIKVNKKKAFSKILPNKADIFLFFIIIFLFFVILTKKYRTRKNSKMHVVIKFCLYYSLDWFKIQTKRGGSKSWSLPNKIPSTYLLNTSQTWRNGQPFSHFFVMAAHLLLTFYEIPQPKDFHIIWHFQTTKRKKV